MSYRRGVRPGAHNTEDCSSARRQSTYMQGRVDPTLERLAEAERREHGSPVPAPQTRSPCEWGSPLLRLSAFGKGPVWIGDADVDVKL